MLLLQFTLALTVGVFQSQYDGWLFFSLPGYFFLNVLIKLWCKIYQNWSRMSVSAFLYSVGILLLSGNLAWMTSWYQPPGGPWMKESHRNLYLLWKLDLFDLIHWIYLNLVTLFQGVPTDSTFSVRWSVTPPCTLYHPNLIIGSAVYLQLYYSFIGWNWLIVNISMYLYVSRIERVCEKQWHHYIVCPPERTNELIYQL